MRPWVLKCQQTVYKTRSLQRRPVPSPAIYYKLDYRFVIANKKGGRSQPNKGTRRSKKRASNKNSSKPRAMPKFALSECAANYAKAISNPFSTQVGVCIPTSSGIVRPSMKVRAITRFVASVGTNTSGPLGYALFMPTVANNCTTVLYSDAGSNLTSASPALPPGPGVQFVTLTSLPYRKTDFLGGTPFTSPSVQGRIVSYGVRFRYIGTELNKGGRMYCLVEPDHDNLYGAGFQSLGNYKECICLPVSRTWQEMVVCSQSSTEVDYPQNQYALAASSVAGVTADACEELLSCYPLSQMQFLSATAANALSVVGGAPLAILFDGMAGNTFEFEVVTHVEYVGSISQSMLTESHADSQGFSIVQNTAGRVNQMRAESPSYMSQAKAFASGMADSVASQTGFGMRDAGRLIGDIGAEYGRFRLRGGRRRHRELLG